MSDFEKQGRAVRDFCEERDWGRFHTPKELVIGMVTEASELLELFRFQSAEQMEAMMRDREMRIKIGDELADQLFFLLRFADLYGFDLGKELERKIALNAERYPIEVAFGNNEKAS